ncbi:MAG: hypothetical protein HY787_05815 [Deltaproteobacteria bacterium]|nr:hypothetical protein [Deltaproteobacteria bacterium]
MNNHSDERIERLFKTARAVRLDTTNLEAGFEEHLAARLRATKQKETPFTFWTWRLAPVMTAALFILIVLNAVIEPQRSSDIFTPIING